MKITRRPNNARLGGRQLIRGWIKLLVSSALIWCATPTMAQLPQSFTVTVDIGGGEMVELNLSKHSIRSADCRVVTWDSTNSYVEVHTPSNPAHPSRTYRGYVTENPNHVVMATVHSGDSLQAEAHDGEGRVWSISGVNVATELGNGNSNTPTPAPLSAGSGTTVTPGNPGQYMPPIGLYQAHGVEDVPSRFYDSNGGSVADTLTWLEHQWNVFDYFNARDAKLSMALTEIIIRKEQYYFPASGSASAFNSLLRNEWQTQGQNKRGFIHSWFPYNFSYAGGYNSGKNMYAAGGEAIAVNALYHEVGHAWRCEHYYYGKETMTGSHPSHSEPNTQRVLYTRQLEIDQDDGIELLTSYATNVHPRAAADMTTTMVDTAVNISPMDNDYDANGDVISIKSYTTNTAKGGSVTESNGVLTYTPANGYVGKDIIVYEVQDTAGLYAKGLITIEVINGGLAAHWDMEDSSGTNATDLSGNGHDGALVGADFATATVPGPVGNAVALTASQYMIADDSNLILDPDTTYPLDAATSNFFDPIDADFSAAAWVKLAPGSSSAVLMSKTNKASFGYRILLNTSSGVTANLRVWDGLTGSTTASGGNIAEDTWYHVAMIINRGDNTLKVYLNGQEVGSASVPANFPIFNGREDLKIGGDIYGDSGGAIVVDDVRIYTKALNISEVSALHAQGDVPAGEPSPASGSVNLAASSLDLSWVAGQTSYQHDVYFGTDAAAVAAATTTSPEYKGRQSGVSFNPGTLNFSTNYFWRIDEVDGSTIIGGRVWSFATAASELTENLVLHLTMDAADVQNADGNAHTWDDLAFPAQDFEPFGEVSEGTTGIIGQAVDLSATDDSLRSKMVNPIQRPSSGGVTFSFWINTTSTLNGGQKLYDAGGAYFLRYYNGDLMPVFDGSSGGAQIFDVNINDGQWHHVVATNDGAGTTTVYVDGVAIGTQSESLYNVASLNRTLAIGSIYNGTGENLDALFDDYAVWERALTPTEITNIHAVGLAGNSFSDVPMLTNTSFEAADGFTGFSAGNSSTFSSVTGNDGSIWTSVSDARIWNRTDIPPDGVQTLALGLGGSGDSKVDLSFPGTDHGVGTVSFDYASYSSSANATFRLLYNDGSGWVEAWSTQIIGMNPNFATKPWPTAEVAINVPGDVNLRFEATGAKGAKFDNVKVTGRTAAANNAPTADDASGSVAENAGAGASVLTITASDPDAGDSLGYAITAGNGSGLFAIDSNGAITTTSDLDHEAQSQHVLTVTVTDGGGLTDTATITIDVNDVNEAPTANNASGSVAENGAGGLAVATVTASDPDAGDSLGYVITAGNTGGQFTIDSDGNVTTTSALNYEAASQHVLTVTVTDSGSLSDTATVTVNVNNLNEAPSAADVAGSLAENAGAGAAVATVLASDPDAGDSLGYAITAGNGSGLFAINATGNVTTTSDLDYESAVQHVLTVTVTDGGGLSDTATVTVDVTNVNEAPVASDTSGSVAEDASNGTLVATVSSVDPDAGDSVSYAITGGNTGSAFAIDSSGNVTTAAALDYDTTASYTLTVTATDNGGLADTAIVTVTVTSVNSDPVFANDLIAGSDALISAAYSATLDGTATDADTGDVLTYSKVNGPAWLTVASDGALSGTPVLADAGLNAFVVEVSDGNGGTAQASLNITVQTNGVLFLEDFQGYDVENPSDFSVGGIPTGNWTASNTGSNATRIFNTGNFGGSRLWISNVDGTSITSAGIPATSNADYSLSSVMLTETSVGSRTLNANYDVLVGQDAATAVSIIGGPQAVVTNGDDWQTANSKVDHVFNQNFQTGTLNAGDQIFVRFERVNVQATGGWFGVDDVQVDLNGVNTAPVASDDVFAIDENSAASTAVGSVNASDPDAGDSLSYAITAGNASGAFAIDASGNLTVAGSLDYESTSQYVLTVTVSDDGAPSLSDTATITVNVSDVNEAPVANDSSGNVAEDATNGTVVASVLASDVDAGDSLAYAITAGNTGGAFAIDGNGVIATTAGLDFETTSSYSLTVTVTDNGLLTDMATVAVTVNDVNEAPVANSTSGSIAENTAAGAAVATVVATDVDTGDSLSYAITSGNTGNAFSIDSSGNITNNIALDYETLSSYVLTVTVTDSGALTDTATVSVSVTDVVETTAPVVITGAASNLSQSGADIAYTVSDDGGEAPTVTVYYGETNGGTVPANWSDSSSQGIKATGGHLTALSGLTEGTTYYFTVHASNSAGESWGSAGSFTTVADTSPKLVRTTVNAVSNSSWTTVDLGQNYNSAVIIATPIYPNSTTPPVVTRITNVSGSSFDLKLDRADGQTGAVSVDVSIIAVEEGVYTQATDGVTMEAVKYTSTVTADNNSWVGETRSYQNTYTSPVVVGQVMSANDANWSVFWSMGNSRTAPASASVLNVGKHVGEDPNATRANETIGYIVIESGSGTINGVAYEAALGADTVRGFGNSATPYSYSLSGSLGSVSSAALSISGMDGNNGAWAVLSGSTPLTTTAIGLHAVEDQMNDAEQSHSTTQVGYIVFE